MAEITDDGQCLEELGIRIADFFQVIDILNALYGFSIFPG